VNGVDPCRIVSPTPEPLLRNGDVDFISSNYHTPCSSPIQTNEGASANQAISDASQFIQHVLNDIGRCAARCQNGTWKSTAKRDKDFCAITHYLKQHTKTPAWYHNRYLIEQLERTKRWICIEHLSAYKESPDVHAVIISMVLIVFKIMKVLLLCLMVYYNPFRRPESI
jgi:hypothetical protein